MSGPRFEFPDDEAKFLSAHLGEYAILDADGNVLSASIGEWGEWFGRNNGQRIIEQTELAGQIEVSTVFLGLNHQYLPAGPPLWFETMIFGPPETAWNDILNKEWTSRPDLWIRRTTTLKEAKEAHLEGIEWVKAQDWFINERSPSTGRDMIGGDER